VLGEHGVLPVAPFGAVARRAHLREPGLVLGVQPRGIAVGLLATCVQHPLHALH